MDFKINELDRDTLRQWFIWCSSNNIKLKADYTEFIKLNNLWGVNSMDTLNGYTTYRYDKYQELYLDYVNNFLTVKRFAEYYNMSIDYANHVIEVGRKLNNN